MVTNTGSHQTCPRCGAPDNQVVSGGLCPACLLKQVALGTGADSFSAEPWAPPERSALASAFPHLAIIELIGRGGMGAVYKARQKSLGRFVALKILSPQHAANPSFAERFSREARAMAELNHPNIVTVHDFGQAGEFYFLLMEHVDGVNLRQAMQAGRLRPPQALAIVPSICEALQFAHDHGVVHRDIKPENLLLDQSGRVKIADFGIARITGAEPEIDSSAASPEAEGLTQESVLGTPHYMAPEQSARPAQVDHRADIYSLGVVLYELLTGELPLGRFEPPSHKVHIDVRLDSIVLRALERTPELRYQTIGEMRAQVETVVNDSGPPSTGSRAQVPSPPQVHEGKSYVSTSEELATFEGQFSLYRRKSTLNLDDRQLTFARAGATTVIPLAAVCDLSIGRYPRTMNPVGLDFISVTYNERGQSRRFLFTPFQGLFGLPSQFNEYVAEWFNSIRAATFAATGHAPGSTPAGELGTPRGSLKFCALMLLSFLVPASAVLALLASRATWSLAGLPIAICCAVGASAWMLRGTRSKPAQDRDWFP